MLCAGFLFDLLFDPEDRGSTLLWNVGKPISRPHDVISQTGAFFMLRFFLGAVFNLQDLI
jgi:hypothetical protein